MHRTMWIAAALCLTVPAAGHAQGWIDVERPVDRSLPASAVVRVSSRVKTTIEGRVARVEVEERFRNVGGGLAEASYLYPMPGEAVFSDFSLWAGDHELRGEVMTADQARGIYEEIVRRRKDPALLTFAGHGLIRARVFPIQPGETRKVVLRYTQVLERAGDALRLHYTIGQRERSPGEGWRDRATDVVFSYRVTAPSSGDYGTPYSPTHHLTVNRENGRLEVALDPDAAGDLELFFPLRRRLVGTSVVTHAPGGEDGYFMLLLAPPATDDGQAIPRDLSLVVDVSGSMSGRKLEQAQAALRQALEALHPEDRFRLVAFSSTVRPFREDFVAATPENLRAARGFVDALRADGGTNIAGALEAVLGRDVSERRLPIVVFVTDGLPSVGERAPDRIADAAAARAGQSRIFTVGVGPDVNTYLLDRLAREGRGSAEYVAPDADVEVATGALLDRIRRPALVNLRVVSTPTTLVDASPAQLPDLFYGEELVVFGRYRGHASGDLVIEGERNGHRERFTARAVFAESESGNDFIPRLWASRRIGDLTRQIRIEGSTPGLVDQVRQLGLRYGILTEYTSFLIQEPGFAQTPPIDEHLAPMLQGGAAAAPSQTGTVAFEQARASARMSQASNLAAADAVAESKLQALRSAGSGEIPAIRRVGGRVFVKRGTVWTDAAASDRQEVVVVAPFSEAYFALVRALPEITPYLGVGEEMVLAGRGVNISIAAAGLRSWDAGRLATVVKAWRGA